MARKGPWEGMNFQQFSLQQAMTAAHAAKYCRYCGKDIKEPGMNSTRYESGWYDDWELDNNAHRKCYRNQMNGGY
jgi:hypothetical protein